MWLHLDFMYKERSLVDLGFGDLNLPYSARWCLNMCLVYLMCACLLCLMWVVTVFNRQTHEATSRLHLQHKNLVCLPLHCLNTLVRATRKEKLTKLTKESRMLSNMAQSYYNHFATYSKGRKQVTQLVPNMVWKLVYADFKAGKP